MPCHADDIFIEMTNVALSLLRLMQKAGENLLEIAENVYTSTQKKH
jgi:NAD(P)H-hydrate repair Nnr-like enzyme with NAD(P)H-hydrate epimerase domain